MINIAVVIAQGCAKHRSIEQRGARFEARNIRLQVRFRTVSIANAVKKLGTVDDAIHA
jgi:hypothetical protein